MMDRSEVVVVSTDGAQHAPAKRGGPVPIEELARRQGVGPVESPDDMARDVFSSDEELDEFLAFIADARHSDVA